MDIAAIWRPCIPRRRTSCMESVTDRTETHAVVDNNIQLSFKDISVELSVPPTDYGMHHRANWGGTLQMQPLLLLLLCVWLWDLILIDHYFCIFGSESFGSQGIK